MPCVKLTDKDGKTRNCTQWGPGMQHEAAPGSPELCGKTVIHYYEAESEEDALALALLMDPVHGQFGENLRAWCWASEGESVTDGVKSGAKAGRVIAEIADVPVVTVEQRVRFAIRASLRLPQAPEYQSWAEAWLSGEDRSGRAAARAAKAAWAAAEEAWAEVARAAAEAAAAKAAGAAAKAVAWAARAAAKAARAAAKAARAAAKAAGDSYWVAQLAGEVVFGTARSAGE